MPRTAWVLFAGTFVLRLGSFVFPFLALYLTKNGLSVTEAGLAITGYGVGAMLAQLSGGLLTDRIGRRNAIAISMITSAAMVLLLLQARSLPAVLIIVVVYAFFAELHRPASGALIADLIPPEHRVAAYAFNRLLFNLSFAIGLAIGGLLAEEHFRELFIADAATSVAFGVISLVALPHGTRTTKEQDREIGSARAAILADKGFLLVLGAILAGGLVYAQGYSTFPLWVRDRGFPERVYGFLQGSNGILVVVFELGVTAIAMRHPRTRMIALGVLLTGLGYGGFGLLLSGVGMAVAVAVWSFGAMFGSPSTAAFIADRAPAHLRGRYQSSLGITYALAFTIGPIGGTAIYGWWPRGLWIVCAALGLLGAAVPGTEGRSATSGLTPAFLLGYISNRYTASIYRVATTRGNLDMLELAVLGLLKERPMHGYQLSRELSDSLGGLWRVSYGSLYPTLRRLEADTAIESEAGDERGARRKKVYRITPKGEQIFIELLQESPNDTQSEDARFRMRLAFFRYLPPETRIRLLERRRQALQDRLATIAESERTGRGGDDDYSRALIEHNRTVTESDITWLDQLIAAERAKNVTTGGLKRRREALRGKAGSSSEAVAQRKERIS
jgi:DNA-binding PadR family transcriptional regulator/predicted MFS family arabinose efflux permease